MDIEILSNYRIKKEEDPPPTPTENNLIPSVLPNNADLNQDEVPSEIIDVNVMEGTIGINVIVYLKHLIIIIIFDILMYLENRYSSG